jgi:hypothetical protein
MKTILILASLLFSSLVGAKTRIDLRTLAEKTDWKKTGRADETARLCLDFQKQYPSQVSCKILGKTPEYRDHFYMVVGNPKNPVVWVQAGIHAGEIDGKDAVFLLINEILSKKLKPDPLKGLCMVFIPIMNLDGHERFGKYNRPNQIGPEEMGWRTTSQNLNLNRDFMKVDAPEMRDILKLWHQMDPILSLDLHVTDGAQFQPEVGLIVLPNDFHGSSSLHKFGKAFETDLVNKLNSKEHLALPFYPSFEDEENPLSGFSRYVATARFSQGYWYNNNRLGMLVETHSWKDYANRVRTHHDTVLASLELAQLNSKEWKEAASELDLQKLAGTKVDLEYKRTEKSRMIDFQGFEFSKKKSLVSGHDVLKYNPLVPQIWKVPFYEELKPTLTVDAPVEGYFIQPADLFWILPKLQVHAIKYLTWNKNNPTDLKIYRATKTLFSVKSYEGHQTLTTEGEWRKEDVLLPKGSIFVPINQPKARLVLQLLEPQAQDSFSSWGFFNKSFEQKEYMENYVTEDVALEMLKQPEIQEEFAAKIKADPEFAKDPDKRFEFFYKKHASWDERLNKYPVFKK